MTTSRKREPRPPPDSPEVAANQFMELTGIDLATDEACVAVADVLEAWRSALAFVEYKPLVDAVHQTDEQIRRRSVRAIPTFAPVRQRTRPGALSIMTAGHVAAFEQGIHWIHDGVERLERGIAWAKETGLVPARRTGRPREALDSALCVLMVDYWERRERRPPLSSTQVALAAFAFGIAKPPRDWRAWSERWRRLLKRARAVKAGLSSPEGRVLAYALKARQNS